MKWKITTIVTKKIIYHLNDITEKTWKINQKYSFAAQCSLEIYSSVSKSSEQNNTRQCREPLVDVWCVMQWNISLAKCLQPFFNNHVNADTWK
jgi:hypothetical protein